MARCRVYAALALMLACGAAEIVGAGGAGAASAGITPGWSAPVTVMPRSGYAFSLALAVNGPGDAVAAWFSGPPPPVSAGGRGAPVDPAAPAAASWDGVNVMASLGSVTGGLRAPVVIATNGDDEDGGVMVAMSGSGVGYVAWQAGGGWMIATTRDGPIGRPRRLAVPAGAQVQGLVSGPDGPVAAVWIRFGVHSVPGLYDAPLRTDGELGRVVTVGHLGSPVSNIEVAVNDHGALAASWVLGANGAELPHSHERAPIVRAALCSARGRCGLAQTLALGPTVPRFVATATTLSDDGTATVLTGGQDWDVNGERESGEHGLYAAVSRDGGRFVATPLISSTGDHPVAIGAGSGGAVALYNVGSPPIDTIAWSTLGPRSGQFMTPRDLPDRDTVNPPIVAANQTGTFVALWNDEPRIVNAPYSLRGAQGTAAGIGPPRTVAPASSAVAEGSEVLGIDARGDALAMWESYGAGSGYTHGVFLATLRP